MIVSTLLLPLLAATFAALAVAWLKRLPTLHLCPTCARRTHAVLLPTLLRPWKRWIGRRWCSACAWEGIGRKGPEFIPGRPLAHDSGFHWGADLIGQNAGFRWARLDPPEPRDPSSEPHQPSSEWLNHRSGFRFRGGPTPSQLQAHPSGFTWSGAHAEVPDVDRRSAFFGGISKPRRTDGAGGFEWGQSPVGRPPRL